MVSPAFWPGDVVAIDGVRFTVADWPVRANGLARDDVGLLRGADAGACLFDSPDLWHMFWRMELVRRSPEVAALWSLREWASKMKFAPRRRAVRWSRPMAEAAE